MELYQHKFLQRTCSETTTKSAIILICHAKYNAHTESLFKKQEILKLPDMVIFFKLQFVQQFKQFKPTAFESIRVTNAEKRTEDQPALSNEVDFYLPFAKSNSIELMPLFSFPKTCNEFPDAQIKFICAKTKFNRELKQGQEFINVNIIM
jgi:hypothetical protein